MSECIAITDAARAYLSAGLCVLPAKRAEKRPAIGSWKRYQDRLPTDAELTTWLANGPDALCILCGKASGNAEAIDFDAGGERFLAWWELVPADLRSRIVVETTPSGGMHVIYRCQTPVCGNLKLAQRKAGDQIVTLIETRGEGGLFLCAPTPGYMLAHGDLTDLPVLSEAERDVLLQAAWALNEYVPPALNGPARADVGHVSRPAAAGAHARPGDDFNARGDVRALLETHGWTRASGGSGGNEYWRRPGKTSGWSASLKDRAFYVFSSNASPFEQNRAYSPFSVFALLNHAGDFEQAASALRHQGYGGDDHPDAYPGVDISGIVAAASKQDDEDDVEPDDVGDDAVADEDPGPVPDSLLHVPGFIGELIDFCITGAPYPSLGMAFCGALAMQAHLCGRRVREPGDLRTNIYVLALGSSSAGKNYPRELNAYLSIAANLTETIRRKFSSGEGIEDRLESQPCTLFQTDEIDGMLQSINRSKDARHESILSILLEMFSAANMMYSMRSKAGKQSAGIIHQPHLTIFGTATPGHYYEAMSHRMLTNGFFARLIIVDTGKRSLGQDAVPVEQLPKRLIDTATWWANFQPGEHRGNLIGFYPKPAVVPYTDEAKRVADDFRVAADQFYSQAEDRSDDVAMTVWGRANENARKLALLHACSENHRDPKITAAGIAWATAFIEHQCRRMLFMARQYVAADDFDSTCKRAVRILRQWHVKNGADKLMPPWKLRRQLKVHPTAFKDVTFELAERRIAICEFEPGKTKAKQGFRLL